MDATRITAAALNKFLTTPPLRNTNALSDDLRSCAATIHDRHQLRQLIFFLRPQMKLIAPAPALIDTWSFFFLFLATICYPPGVQWWTIHLDFFRFSIQNGQLQRVRPEAELFIGRFE